MKQKFPYRRFLLLLGKMRKLFRWSVDESGRVRGTLKRPNPRYPGAEAVIACPLTAGAYLLGYGELLPAGRVWDAVSMLNLSEEMAEAVINSADNETARANSVLEGTKMRRGKRVRAHMLALLGLEEWSAA